jgi:hypothetical protein
MPGAAAVAVAVQVIVVPDSVPCPVPVTLSVPRQVALNVPDPVLPDTSVTDHLKSVHVFWSVVADAIDAHDPARSCALTLVELVDEGLRKLKQAALSIAAIEVARSSLRVII